MSKIYPYFEVDGKRYEFKRNRFLMMVLDELKENDVATDEETRQYSKMMDLKSKVEKLAERRTELESKYLESFDDEVGALLKKCETAYILAKEEMLEYEIETKISSAIEEKTLKKAENFVLEALQHDEKGKVVRSKEEAESIWCAWVDEVGEQVASSFAVLTVNHIAGTDEEAEENDFFTQMKAKAVERANNRRAGLKMVK